MNVYDGIARLSETQINNTTQGFSENYKKNIKMFKSLVNENISKSEKHDAEHQKKYLRIMTWNVRYFTNIDNKPTINEIKEVIDIINPDILCLNEFTLGKNNYYDDDFSFEKNFLEYKVIAVCNTVPAWYSTIYGNAILMRKSVYNGICNLESALQTNILNVNKKCFLNQSIHTYEYPKPYPVILDDIQINSVGTSETRCFIKITLPDFDIYCTHLEAYDKETRAKQFAELMSHVTRKSIIIGDLNIINTSEYIPFGTDSVEWQTLKRVNSLSDIKEENEIEIIKKKYDLKDSVELGEIELGEPDFIHPGFTTWTNTIVDYILFTNHWWKSDLTEMRQYIYLTDATDHCPIYVDINQYHILGDIYDIKTKKIGTITTLNNLGYDHNTLFYHVTPLTAYDWFNNGKVSPKYTFSDPYLTGNFGMTLGANGIYVGNPLYVAVRFLDSLIARTDQQSKIYKNINDKFNVDNVGLLYTFRIRSTYDLENQIYEFISGDYDTSIDEKYDLISTRGIEKMTQRNFNRETGLHDVFELYGVQLIFYDKIHPQYNNMEIIANQFKSALDFIIYKNINKSYSLADNGFDSTFDPKKITYIESGDDLSVKNFVYNIWEDYEKKYYKYKKKYLNLKNNKIR